MFKHCVIRKIQYHLLLGMILGLFSCMSSAQSQAAQIVSTENTNLAGTIRFKGRGAKRAKMEDTVVYFIPDSFSDAHVAQGYQAQDSYRMQMIRKRFSPKVLPVPVGSRVEIPNVDRFAHNAFSPSEGNEFDLGTYKNGESGEITINQSGIVKVFCNVHYHMVGYIVALETPFYGQPSVDGEFSIPLHKGMSGTLHIWHPNAKPIVKNLDLKNNAQKKGMTFVMEVSKRKVPKHKNKFGRSYRSNVDIYDQ